MKKKTFLPYHRWPLMLFGFFMVLLFFAGAVLALIGAFFNVKEYPWLLPMMAVSAALAVYVAVIMAQELLMELPLTCAPISLSEEGISIGLLRKRSYRWDEVTQFGATMIDPPPRNHPFAKANSEPKPRSIYLVFGLPGEKAASVWEISRLGAIEFWVHCRWPDVTLSYAENVLCLLAPRKSKIREKLRDYTKGVYFPKRFIAMKYSPERFTLIYSYLQKAERGSQGFLHT